MSHFLAPVFEVGFFESDAVRTAVIVGAAVAVVAGALGVFTVMRGQSFAAEAFGDIGTSGGSGAFLIGAAPLVGFLVFGVLAAGAMELVGIQRARGRDLATGIALGAALGLAALFMYLDSTIHNTTGVVVTILFGSIFEIAGSTIPLVAALAAAVVAVLLVIHRPLLLSTVSPEIAGARGVPVRIVGATYLLALAAAVALCALTIGSILSTALLIGPAAAALRATRRPGRAVLLAAALGVAAMWLGIVLAYDSYYWPPRGNGWPVSFFVVTIVFVVYLLSGVPAWRERRRAHAATARRAFADDRGTPHRATAG
ncbi:MAG: metal ABC transporter permease [Solirubrobacterales bacterium]|nr:metal ABC transporter permease [Solirubrobacterales bacterium]